MKRIFGKIGFVWFALVFVSLFLLLYPFFLVLLSKEKYYPKANVLRKVWAWSAVFLSFSWPQIKRLEKQFPEKCLFVSNHTSYFDIIVLGLFAPTKVCFMGKKELGEIPLFGIFFRTVDISVDRSSAINSHKAFMTAKERIDKGYSVLIFPEGTIWNKTPQLKPFKNGAFKMAIECQVPIVPVTFINNFKTLPDEKYEYYPNIIKCTVHRAIYTDHLNSDDANTLKDEIYTLIEQELKDNHILQ